MEIIETSIPDVKIVVPKMHADARGFFSETYRADALGRAGISIPFVQDNHAMSVQKNVVRGLHYQVSEWAQAKLVRVVRGAIFDVAVDIRKNSPTYGRHVAVELSAENWKQLFIPAGFAHGYATLEPNTEVIYKVNAPYAPQHERGILWNDPRLGIAWPVKESDAILSDKDKALPLFVHAMKT